MTRIVMTNGWSSFEAWKAAGFPGARSFPAERKPDPRAGLCTVPGCDNVEEAGGRCRSHYYASVMRR